MRNEIKLKYSIVIPAKNEEKFIGQTLESIVNQTYLPWELTVVDDDSTDRTAQIVQEFADRFPFIKIIHSGNHQPSHEPGSKIIEAFYKGFHTLQPDWDAVSKLDADVILPPNYFEKIMNALQTNPQIGMAGGLVYIQKEGTWVYENISDKKHIRGAIKTYSRPCFEKIGGLRKSIGWDTVDELLARFYGFEIAVFPDLEVKLLKPTGNDYKSIHGEKTGEGFYKMDYGWAISFIAALKAAWNAGKPFLFVSVSKGYWKAALRNEAKIVSAREGTFIRRYRWTKILKRFLNPR